MLCKICNPNLMGDGYCGKHSTSGIAYKIENKNMEKEKQKTGECRHLFTLSRIDAEQINQGVSNTEYFYQRIAAYMVCEKCGEVRKQLI